MYMGSLESKIGFKWRDESIETQCAITGELFKSNIGLNPILIPVSGASMLKNSFINSKLLSQHAASIYIEWRGLLIKHGNKIKPNEDIILSKTVFKMPCDSEDLVLMFRESCKNIARKSTNSEVNTDTIVQEIANHGFMLKPSCTGKNFAEESIRKILAPMLVKKHHKSKKIAIQ